MDDVIKQRVQTVQSRINAALHESAEESARSTFSSYVPGASTEVQAKLWTSPATGRLEDLEQILDRFERMAGAEDPGRLRHALDVVLTHHPTVAAFGLRLPSLEERSPRRVRPSG
jgi:hypothetical protein